MTTANFCVKNMKTFLQILILSTSTVLLLLPSGITCGETSCSYGRVYVSGCGSGCRWTCDNINDYNETYPYLCPAVCVSGCLCTGGMVEKGDGCIAPEYCHLNFTFTGQPLHCQLPSVSGPCEAYVPSFFYNSTSMKCESFVYGGCDGNDNRFGSKSECEDTCGGEPSRLGLYIGVPVAAVVFVLIAVTIVTVVIIMVVVSKHRGSSRHSEAEKVSPDKHQLEEYS